MKPIDIVSALRLPCIEPRKRKVGGIYTWATHRFPIKNGITATQVILKEITENVGRNNTLFQHLNKK